MKNNYRSKNGVFKGREAERRRREGETKGEWVLLMGSIKWRGEVVIYGC